MSNCPSCNTSNSRFLYIIKKVIGKTIQCSNCKKELFLNGLSKTLMQASGGAVIATLILYKFYYEKSNSSTLTIAFSAIAAFLITFVLDVWKLNFSLGKNEIVEVEKVENEKIKTVKAESNIENSKNHLYDIYSKRSSEELEEMLNNDVIIPESKEIIRGILDERIGED
jgi:hypothetical protein